MNVFSRSDSKKQQEFDENYAKGIKFRDVLRNINPLPASTKFHHTPVVISKDFNKGGSRCHHAHMF